MRIYNEKHVYIEGYSEMEIYNIELDTDEETYFDVNINLKQKGEIISAATFECGSLETAQKLAKGLAKQYNAECVGFVE